MCSMHEEAQVVCQPNEREAVPAGLDIPPADWQQRLVILDAHLNQDSTIGACAAAYFHPQRPVSLYKEGTLLLWPSEPRMQRVIPL